MARLTWVLAVVRVTTSRSALSSLLSLSATSAINSRSPAVSSPSCSGDEPEALGGGGELCGAQAKLGARCRICAASEVLVEAVAPPTGADENGETRTRTDTVAGSGTELGGLVVMMERISWRSRSCGWAGGPGDEGRKHGSRSRGRGTPRPSPPAD